MRSEIFGTICQMGIFIICAQSIVHFRPRAVYEKYLKMLISVMILVQLFLPVGRFFFGRNAEEFSERVEEFENSFSIGRREAEEKAAQSRKKLEQMSLEEVRTRLERKASEEETHPAAIEPVEQIVIEIGEEAGR